MKSARSLPAIPLLLLLCVALIGPDAARAGTSHRQSAVHSAGKPGSGNRHRETRVLPAFTKIESDGCLDIVVSVGGPQSVVVVFDDNLIDRIRTKVVGDKLKITTKGNFTTKSEGQIEISVPSLQSMQADGFGDITIEGLQGESFVLKHNGAGDVRLAGSVDDLEIDLDGWGNIDAADLQARSGRIQIDGLGDVHVSVSDRLVGAVDGMGDLYYRGEPDHVSLSVSGLGETIQE